MEWRLFPEDTIPEFATPVFFAGHPWIDPVHQIGHAERTDMAADLVADVVRHRGVRTLTDLGCGDGSLLVKVAARTSVTSWGYDLGEQNLEVAVAHGVDARRGDLLRDALEYGDLLVATEVVEHLVDPHTFIRSLPGRLLVLSSPCRETDVDHYEHHCWAWDEEGYRAMLTHCGWSVFEQRTCAAGFQAVAAARDE